MLRLRAIRRVSGPRSVRTQTGVFHYDESRGDIAHVPEPVANELAAEGTACIPPAAELVAGHWQVRRRAGFGDVLCLSAALKELRRLGGSVEVTTHPNYRLIFDHFSGLSTSGYKHRPVIFDGWLEHHPGRQGRPAAACFADYWNIDLPSLRPYFPLSSDLKARGKEQVAQWRGHGEKVVALFARAGWETRTYLHWKEVAHALARSGCAVIGFDGLILPCCKSPEPMTLSSLAGMVAACDLVVTGDSGPLHLAAALGVPSVSVFGCTNPEGVIGKGYDTVAVVPEGLECWPCWEASCRVGEVDTPGSCVRAIAPELVTRAVLGRLSPAAT